MSTGSPAKTVTLVMLSGGLDSIYSLYKILTETDDEVLVHHIHLVNRERRHVAEKSSCDKVVEFLVRNTRPFHYSESTANHQVFKYMGMDVFIVAHTAGVIARNHFEKTGLRTDRWVSGYCEEERLDEEEASSRMSHLTKICAATCYPLEPPKSDYLFPLLTKSEQINAIPLELVKMAWTCRQPIWTPSGPVECRTCHTCEVVIPIKEGTI